MVFLIFFALHVVACVWWFVKLRDPNLENWLAENNVEDTVASKYLVCFYFGTSTLTTVGYGDISGTDDVERLTACVFMIIGGLLFATIISHLGTLSMSLSQAENEHELRKADVIKFLQGRKVPVDIQKKITTFMDKFATSFTEGPPALDTLPASLKYQLLEVMATSTMNTVHIFRDLPSELLMSIYIKLIPLRCAPGEVLTREGAMGVDMFFLIRGGALILKNGKIVDELSEGDVFGEMAVLAGQRRTATVITKDYAELYVLEKEALDEAIAPFPHMRNELVKRAQMMHKFRQQVAGKKFTAYPENENSGTVQATVRKFVSSFTSRAAVVPIQLDTNGNISNSNFGGNIVETVTFAPAIVPELSSSSSTHSNRNNSARIITPISANNNQNDQNPVHNDIVMDDVSRAASIAGEIERDEDSVDNNIDNDVKIKSGDKPVILHSNIVSSPFQKGLPELAIPELDEASDIFDKQMLPIMTASREVRDPQPLAAADELSLPSSRNRNKLHLNTILSTHSSRGSILGTGGALTNRHLPSIISEMIDSGRNRTSSRLGMAEQATNDLSPQESFALEREKSNLPGRPLDSDKLSSNSDVEMHLIRSNSGKMQHGELDRELFADWGKVAEVALAIQRSAWILQAQSENGSSNSPIQTRALIELQSSLHSLNHFVPLARISAKERGAR